MLTQIIRESHLPGCWIAAVVIAIIALYVFTKIEHFILRLLAGVIGLAAITSVGWRFFLRH